MTGREPWFAALEDYVPQPGDDWYCRCREVAPDRIGTVPVRRPGRQVRCGVCFTDGPGLKPTSHEPSAVKDLPPGSIVIERYVYTDPRGKTGVQWLAQVVSEDGLLMMIDAYRTRREALAVVDPLIADYASRVQRLREALDWAYINVAPLAVTKISLKERVRRLNAYRDHLDELRRPANSQSASEDRGGEPSAPTTDGESAGAAHATTEPADPGSDSGGRRLPEYPLSPLASRRATE